MTTAQIKNSFSSIGEIDSSVSPSTLILKIAITAQAIRYFVISKTHQQVLFFGAYTLHHVSAINELLQRLEKIVEKDEILQLPFSSIQVGLDEPYMLVPTEFAFITDKQSKLTQPCNGTTIVFENIEPLINKLNHLFTDCKIGHLNATFFNLLPHYNTGSNGKLFLNVSLTYFDIISFSALNELQLMNRYNYQAATDLIYFLLLCCEELNIDREITELVLLGEVDIQSKIYDLCYRYFRNISFIQKPDGFQFAKAFDMFPKHLHFNLYNL